MARKKINSGFVTQTFDRESRILKYFPEDYKYFFETPLFGANDFENKSTYIPDSDMEQQLNTFFSFPKSLLAILIGYKGMGKSTILKNVLKVHASDMLSIINDKVIFSKFKWDYPYFEENSYCFEYILQTLISRLCMQYHINWINEKESFFQFLTKNDPSLISIDCHYEQTLVEFSKNNPKLYEARRLQFILQKEKINQFILIIDNIEDLGENSRYYLIKHLVECFRLLTEDSSRLPSVKVLFSFRPDTLYATQQYGCFKDKEIGLYLLQSNTINLEKYFNLKLKNYDKKKGNYEIWSKCLPLFMKVSQKHNRKYDQIIKKLCNYSVPDSMKIYSNILSNSRWMHDTNADYYEKEHNQEYFNINDIVVNNITVIRAISCLEDEMFISKRPVRSSFENTVFKDFQENSSENPSPICNLLYSTPTEDYSIITLYIIKFFYNYCPSNNLYGHIYQKSWDIVRIFSEIFYGIENIEQKVYNCIYYLFDMNILGKSLKTKRGESTKLTSQSRLYLTPRGEIMWEMLSWDTVLLELFREDYYRDYSEDTKNNPFCSYVLMQQGKQYEIFLDLIRMISELLKKEDEYRNKAIENDTITSLKRNFGETCICAQLFEGLKQSMLYSGLIKDNTLNQKFLKLQATINSRL